MAIVQYTAIVNQIRGKLNGSVFNKAKNAYTLQRKQQPKRQASALQSERRAVFSGVQRTWKETTLPERQLAKGAAESNPALDRFGNEVILSPYNQWLKNNLIRVNIDLDLLMAMNPSPAPAFTIQAPTVTYIVNVQAPGGRRLFFNWSGITDSGTDSELHQIIYSSPGVSAGVGGYSGQWYLLKAFEIESGLPPNTLIKSVLDQDAPQRMAVPVPGQVAFVRSDFWDLARGALVLSNVYRVSPTFIGT